MRTASLVGVHANLWAVRGAIYEQPSQLPSLEYDYIVIGGGTAGNVVANRLSENSNTTVLVLEAGGSNEGVLASIVPALGPSLAPFTPYDWNYTTEPMPGLNGRIIPYPRGFILGGTSSINYMVYNRGTRDDFDSYARTGRAAEWSWRSILKYWARRNEHFVPPNDGHDTTGQYLPSEHFETGVLDISLPGYSWPLDERVMALTKELPDQFPYNIDVNTGNPLGISWTQASVGYGKRSSSATSYLGPTYITRPNLSVLLHARVTKIVKTGTLKGLPLFGAVDFALTSSSPTIRVKARKEVVLSAGSFNSPQILMLSGIGDKSELDKFGIKTILDLPGVGNNATDHTVLSNVVYVNTNDTLQKHLSPNVVSSEIALWNQTRKGPLSYTIANHIGWFRLPSNDPVLKKYGDPSSGPTSAHYELFFVPGFAVSGQASPTNGTFNTIFSILISPTSIGTVKLKSANPFDAPLVNPNYLATETDAHIMLSAVRAVQQIAESQSWKGYFQGYYGELAEAKTDQEVIAFARNNSGSIWHFVGTAAMSAKGAKHGVVDPDFRVKGAAGLRVVDASVFPYVPSAHTQGPIYLIAELASDIIKSQARSR